MAAPNPLLFQSSQLWATHVAGQADFPEELLNTRFGIILNTLACSASVESRRMLRAGLLNLYGGSS